MGNRLFYPGNRINKVKPQPSLEGGATRKPAFALANSAQPPRCGVKANAAHSRYISQNGRLDMEDERGAARLGKATLPELAADRRFGGNVVNGALEPLQRPCDSRHERIAWFGTSPVVGLAPFFLQNAP